MLGKNLWFLEQWLGATATTSHVLKEPIHNCNIYISNKFPSGKCNTTEDDLGGLMYEVIPPHDLVLSV